MSPLDQKLLRDLWRIKGQAIAIGAVIAVGVMMLVLMTGLVASLTETRDAYYERYRLADMFAPVSRAPERLADRLAALPGVASVETPRSRTAWGDRSMMRDVRVCGPQSTGRTTTCAPVLGLRTRIRASRQNAVPCGA